ncbi:hypothetical protein [Streptomyces flaveolus]|uniref:hypothetical protein n=1 Tax=Streptomyces flaveolus TaxID=67297 RepID=UPI003F577292
MADLAHGCVRRRLIAVLLWLLALGGVTAGAALAGSAYSNDYEVPGTESDRATRLLEDGSPGLDGDSDTVVWHTVTGTVRAAGVERTVTDTLRRIAALPGVASVAGPYGGQGAHRISADGHTAYATVNHLRHRRGHRVPHRRARVRAAVPGHHLAFVLSGDRVIAMFGIGLASAVALDAFVLRTLLVPALMHLLGAANWWLPGWLERRLPRLGIEPPERRAAQDGLGRAPVDELRKEEWHDVRDIAR